METYYFHSPEVHNTNSASRVVPLLLDIFDPYSVLDVGCGNGSWLKVFQEKGVEILGIDAGFLEEAQLLIDSSRFTRIDLVKSFDIKTKFGMLLCLEVAEHLPESCAASLVNSLVVHSDVIVFSAAVPNQGGQNHINEQVPAYWVDLFNRVGYACYDLIRPLIWEDSGIDWWYRQNMFVCIRNGSSHQNNPALKNLPVNYVPYLIHPDLYNYRVGIIKDLRHQYGLYANDRLDGMKPRYQGHWIVKAINTMINKFRS